MYQVLLKQNRLGFLRKHEQVIAFFKNIVDENADRADRNEPPLDYRGALQAWKDVVNDPEGLRSEVIQVHNSEVQVWKDLAMSVISHNSNQQNNNAQSRAGKRGRSSSSQQQGNGGGAKVPKRGGWCQFFNTQSGCKNRASADGCVSKEGIPYKHGCNLRMGQDGKRCNAKDHNVLNHV